MPKDNSLIEEDSADHSPVGGLSDALYMEIATQCQQDSLPCSPVGGLSLSEYLRIAGSVGH